MVLLASVMVQDGQDNKFDQEDSVWPFLGVVLPRCPCEIFRATFS